jgi:hypothetical protein
MHAKGLRYLVVIPVVLVLIASIQAQPAHQPLSHHVPAAVLTGRAKILGALPSTARMNISMVLAVRNQGDLTRLLSRLYDPSSSDYHRFLSVNEFADRFGPTAEDYQKVVDFAGSNRLEVHTAAANRLTISLTGSAAQVEKAFGVKMQRYQHPTESREFYSPDREPTVPAGLSVRHISGLNNYSLPKSMASRSSTGAGNLDVQGSGPNGFYLASDMRAAYYGGTALTGRGQILGLVQFDGYNFADVISELDGRATSSTSGGDPVVNYTPPGSQTMYSVTVHNVLLDQATGAPGQFIPPADDAEQVLDIVQSIGMAPGLSQVRVYIGNSDVDILSKIASENLANEVSISWAWTPDDPSSVDQFFEEMATQGQSVFAASGDYGAYSPNMPYYFPAEDAWVTAVGGTHLLTNGPGGLATVETAWTQSGGGVSPDQIPIPEWQAGITNSSNQASSTLRNVPDVAMEADFDNWFCNMGECLGGLGGTSFASPRWAAFMALVNEQALAAGDPPAGFINPGIYATGLSPDYGSQFHDVLSGESNFEPGYGFYAVPGYDLVTGWGSPTGQNLIDALAPGTTTGFQLTTTQSGLIIDSGSSAATTIGVIDVGGFSGSVSLAIASALPSGVSASFSLSTTGSTSVLTLTASVLAVKQNFGVTVTGTSGSVQATTYLVVNIAANAVAVLSPAPPAAPVLAGWVRPATVIPVNATVVGHPQSVQLTWAPGLAPASGWSNAGVTLSQTLTPPLSNAAIGTWDTSSITTAGYYTIQVSAVYTEGTVAATTLVYIEADLVSSNWPKYLSGNPGDSSGAVPVSDVSGNTLLAVMEPNRLGGSSQTMYQMFSVDGASNIPASLSVGGAGSAYGILSPGQPGESIMGDGGHVTTVGPDGTVGSLPLNGISAAYTTGTVALTALGGNSSLAAIAVGDQNWNNVDYVYVWGSDGNLLNSNFPVQIPSADFDSKISNNQEIIAGDINGDGNQELIALESFTDSTFTFAEFSNDGTALSGWQAPTFSGLPYMMILADLDHNGKHELIFSVQNQSNSIVTVHALNPDGSERRGWPIQVGYGPVYLAAGDIGQTGNMEIVAAGGQYLNILNGDGTTYSNAWPKPAYTGNNGMGFGPVALADIDGDGQTEILTTNSVLANSGPSSLSTEAPTIVRQNSKATLSAAYVDTTSGQDANTQYWTPQLNAYRLDGSIAKSWMLPGANGLQPCCSPQITVGDFDHSGLTEIAIVNSLVDGGGPDGWEYHGVMEVLSTGTAFNPSANLWPSLYRDTWNTATADFLAPASAPTFNPAAAAYAQTQTVSLFDTTPGAAIYYTTDGTAPGASSTRYAAPITVSSSETIKAVAIASAYTASTVSSASYSMATATAPPTFSLAAGTYTSVQTVSLSDTTPGATIYYTIDGSTPTTGSSLYSGQITVSANETIKAIATATGYSTSAVASATFTINLPAATPVIAPAGGTFTSAQTVSISDTTPGAVIHYTTDGSTPTTTSAIYSGQFTVSANETLQAIAVVSGYTTSAVASASFTINLPPATPVIAPAGGTFTSVQTVTITDTTPGSIILYTIDGSAPTTSSFVYTGPISVAISETLKAVANSSGTLSAVTSVPFTINLPAATPVIAPADGTFSSIQTVTISDTTPSAVIYYTTDGSTPTTGSSVYGGQITVSANETVKAIAIATGYSLSPVASASFTINLPAAAPVIAPAGGTFTSAQSVTISDTTPSAVIYYTTDGSTPTTGSSVYGGQITVSANETVRAIAIASGYSQSPVVSAVYTIDPANAAPAITSISPAYFAAGDAAFSLTVNGNGFVSGSTVYWGNTALSTQFVSAAQLTAQVPASGIATAGITAITVQSPAPGGGTSGTIQFEVDSASAGSSAAPAFTTTSAQVSAGNIAAYPVTLASSVSEVTVSCLNLPAGAACSYSTSTGAVSIATSSSTPAGKYQVTAVFTETQTVSAGFILAPFLLLPLMLLRKKLAANNRMWMTVCLIVGLTLSAIMATGCGSVSAPPSVGSNPTTRQVTSSGVVTLTVQ